MDGAVAVRAIARRGAGLPVGVVSRRWMRCRFTTDVLLGHLDALAAPGGLALDDRGEDADGAVQARARVAEARRSALVGGPSGEPVMLIAPPMAWAIHSKLL